MRSRLDFRNCHSINYVSLCIGQKSIQSRNAVASMRIADSSNPGNSLKELRLRLGITVREVEDQSQRIAETQGNPEFFVSNNWLTRLENTNAVPSIHKLFSLSAIYRVRIAELLPIFGIDTARLQKYEVENAPVHTQLLTLDEVNSEKRVSFPVRFDAGFRVEETNLLSRMVQIWGEIPISLIQNLDIQKGLYGYIGLHDYTMYPLLRPGSFVFIDDSVREVLHGEWKNELDRPIYFIEFRNGYACCWCEKKGGDLLLIPHPLSTRPHQIYPLSEADIIGRVTAIATRIVGPGPGDPLSKTLPQLPKRR
jgi:transcriptional regulator with XRE-family HTH domain